MDQHTPGFRDLRAPFGGIFLDAVLSSKRHKVFRFGTNWVTLGLVVQLPCRPNRFFCLNLLWRLYAKKGAAAAHRTKPQLARELVELVASWLPAAGWWSRAIATTWASSCSRP
jgi:hypothetical protein